MGESEVRASVDDGFERAFGYGIRTERDFCRFVDLMFVYGKRFDAEVPWAAAVLKNDEIEDPSQRLDSIYDLARRRRGSGAR